MPEKSISIKEYEAVIEWMDSREVRKRGDHMVGIHEEGVYIIDGEPLILRGYFNHLIPWPNLMKLNFRMVTNGIAYLACSYNHAQELEETGILKFEKTEE